MSKLKLLLTLVLMAIVVADLLVAMFFIYTTWRRPLDGHKTKDKQWLISTIGKRTYYSIVGFLAVQPAFLLFYKYA
ncbi:hypothetical protein [Roseateles sp. PN1]|uniref:hypothetical protein n=1 Tax=Roseateles sp. PN1 TaxID=3137372 RepID=UPI003139F83F